MDHLPDTQKQSLLHPDKQRIRVIHFSIQPKTWFGNLILVVSGIVAMVVALFLSLIVFAFVTIIVILMLIYLIWMARRVRRRIINNQRDERYRKER
jgi:Flp pilus assembly protein TadB